MDIQYSLAGLSCDSHDLGENVSRWKILFKSLSDLMYFLGSIKNSEISKLVLERRQKTMWDKDFF
jgi:hypothetical protein